MFVGVNSANVQRNVLDAQVDAIQAPSLSKGEEGPGYLPTYYSADHQQMAIRNENLSDSCKSFRVLANIIVDAFISNSPNVSCLSSKLVQANEK